MQINSSLLESIGLGLSEALDRESTPRWIRDLPGGDINRAALLRYAGDDWFLKYHHNASSDMFAAEALALREISGQECIRVPSPIAFGSDGRTAWLVLEHLDLSGNGSSALLGEQLAALHQVTSSHHGWTRNNFIGTTPQDNTRNEDWTTFWRDHRIKPQLALAETGAHGSKLLNRGEQLLASMDQLLDSHSPAASLLHGDLWAGNKAYTADGQPVIFDPASYYGDRETDLAMTRLFGGFEAGFYAAYEARYPLTDGYQLRLELYNLYHMLNHLNLFGSGYYSRCVSMIDSLLAQIR